MSEQYNSHTHAAELADQSCQFDKLNASVAKHCCVESSRIKRSISMQQQQ